jgi:putative endonuclease
MPSERRKAAHRFGLAAENMAAFYLRCKGYSIIAKRYRNTGGEIDVLARKGHTLVAVEVKARQTIEQCEYTVPPWKQQKIARAIEGALAGQGGIGRQIAGLADSKHFTLRFDVIWIAPKRLPRHIIDAWRIN